MLSTLRRLGISTSFAAVLSAVAFLSGCGGEGSAAEGSPDDVTVTELDPANFGNAGTTNPFLPLVPGTQWVREGETDVGSRRVPHQVTTTVTDIYREIEGVRTVVLFDFEVDAGQVAQLSLDYVAVDDDGNVWLLGSYTEEYEGGRFVSTVDPWIAGVNEARAGILVQGDPKAGTPPYAVAQPDVEEDDVAEVIDVGARHCVPFDCFEDVLIVREGKASDPDNEFKYYARGVGQIDNQPRGASVHQDVEQLVNLTKLSAQALAETSGEVLRIDRNARTTAPEVFGELPPAERGR